mmetsp:Transcript_38838/g.81269  ORF Transcript_38838/g.81269 Transcript_38838/m.81269 type:complete len:379 (+) Transcript_38838:27-1163(+)
MNIAISRRYAAKVASQWNATRLKGISTAFNFSKDQTPRAWSESLSFASPESDFVSTPGTKKASTVANNDQPAWSGMLSFASPESDFVSSSKKSHLTDNATESNRPAWSETLSFASSESDFVSASEIVHNTTTAQTDRWSESLSFASPESDFVSAPEIVHNTATVQKDRWSESLSFASPESDFVSATETIYLASSASTNVDSIVQELFQTHHLYMSPETATGSIAYTEMLDETIRNTVMTMQSLQESIPKTMEEALNDERPIVITTTKSPFRVVDVNGAWEGLCGYHRDEAIGHNLGSLLQGPETDTEAANEMVRDLRERGFSETVLTNYAKKGRSFRNHVKIGMIPAAPRTSSASDDAYFVGVLQDIGEMNIQKVATI